MKFKVQGVEDAKISRYPGNLNHLKPLVFFLLYKTYLTIVYETNKSHFFSLKNDCTCRINPVKNLGI